MTRDDTALSCAPPAITSFIFPNSWRITPISVHTRDPLESSCYYPFSRCADLQDYPTVRITSSIIISIYSWCAYFFVYHLSILFLQTQWNESSCYIESCIYKILYTSIMYILVGLKNIFQSQFINKYKIKILFEMDKWWELEYRSSL